MESQGDSLMRRKLERQASGRDNEPTGVQQVASHSIAAASAQPQDMHLPRLTPRQLASTHDSTAKSTVPPYRQHLEARERELQDYIQLQMVAAVQEQRRDEELRAEACRRQRDVERMKLRQRMKKRVELQTAARQPVAQDLQDTMGVRQPELAHLSATAQHRRDLCNVPTKAYLEHNADRLTSAMVHREACRQAERTKAQMRVAMEEYVGTEFAKRRKQMWADADGQREESVRCPTAAERQQSRNRRHRDESARAAEAEELRRVVDEVTRLDDAVYEAERKRRQSGSRSKMAKDVPFNMSADFRHGSRPSTVSS